MAVRNHDSVTLTLHVHGTHRHISTDVRIDDPETPLLLVNVNVPRATSMMARPFFRAIVSFTRRLASPTARTLISSARFFTTPKEGFSSPRTHRGGRESER